MPAPLWNLDEGSIETADQLAGLDSLNNSLSLITSSPSWHIPLFTHSKDLFDSWFGSIILRFVNNRVASSYIDAITEISERYRSKYLYIRLDACVLSKWTPEKM